ncbi:MAG TPA: hypothetical protein DDW95_05010, partial [Alphaproteobacteria bacterium]|nr:hypothetical protein [Alphaproteobacteria bacterium]
MNLRVRRLHATGTGTAIVFAPSRQFSVCLIALLLTTGAAMLGGCSPINHLRDDYMGKSLLQPGKARPGNGSMTDP